MRTELEGGERFRVVERAQIKQALQEQTLQLSGGTDTQNAVKIGKLLGADLIIVGSVVKIGNSYTVNSRMIDVKTGEAQLGRNATGTDLNLLNSLSRELLDGLFGGGKKLAAKGRRCPKRRSPRPLSPLLRKPPVKRERRPAGILKPATCRAGSPRAMPSEPSLPMETTPPPANAARLQIIRETNGSAPSKVAPPRLRLRAPFKVTSPREN